MTSDRLTRDDWMRAAREALVAGGPDAVRVERLAAALGVTKGSFYWHFHDRTALLAALVDEWVEERELALAALSTDRGQDALRALLAFMGPRVTTTDTGELPSDAAMFAWAATDADVAARVNAAEDDRIALIQRVVGDAELGEFLYLAYLGFMMRRRRVPAQSQFFPRFASLVEDLAAHRQASAAGGRDRDRRPAPTHGRPPRPPVESR